MVPGGFEMRFFIFLLLTLTAHASNKFAAIVVDGETGRVLYGANENERRYPASLAKKMTLYILFDALKKKRISMNTQLTASKRASIQGPSKIGLKPGQTLTIETLIKSLAIKSANDAAIAAAEFMSGSVENFAKLMNETARKIGMTRTNFRNPGGLNDQHTNDKGQYTTAKDMSILGIALYRDFPEYMYIFKLRGFNFQGRSIRTHNNMLGEVHGLDGIKTGYIIASGFNISTSSIRYNKNNKPYRLFAVVMGGHSARSRDRKAAELIEYGFQQVGFKNPQTFSNRNDLDSLLEEVTPVEFRNAMAEKKKYSTQHKRQKH